MTLLRTIITRTALLIGVATVGSAWPGGASTAGATQQGWLTVPSGLPLFDLADIAPGESGSATFTVSNPQAFPVNFSVVVTGLANDDNGCNEPEEAIGDSTCGAGGGDLQFDLLLSLSTTGSTERSIASGTLVEWATQTMVDPVLIGAYGNRTYRLGYELPIASTNITQSDLVSFQFEMSLDQGLGTVIASDPPSALIIATPLLARTGSDTRATMAIGLSVLLVGLVLYRMSTRRRRAA